MCVKSAIKIVLGVSIVVVLGALEGLGNAMAEETIYTPPLVNENDRYCFEMLKHALSYSGKQFDVRPISQAELTQPRIMEMIQSGDLQVFWTASDKDIEAHFTPVRIPLFKGMFGYRIFLINKNNQAKFDSIQTLEQLKNQITLGQGRTWADTQILKAAGLNVITTLKFPGLMYMVDGGRFDAFPRAIHEPWNELKAFSQLDLTVERNLLLVYKMPFYLFTAKDNPALAALVHDGLEKALADGSFNKMFFENDDVKQALANANLKQRRVIEIANPNLSAETPMSRPELWLDISQL